MGVPPSPTALTGTAHFVAGWDDSGNLKWAKSAGKSDLLNTSGDGIATDNSGNVYVTGSFNCSRLWWDNDTVVAAGPAEYSDLFVAALSPAGDVVWVKGIHEPDSISVVGRGVVARSGRCIVFGELMTSDTVKFDEEIIPPFTRTWDIFIAALALDPLAVQPRFGDRGLLPSKPASAYGSGQSIRVEQALLRADRGIAIHNCLGQSVLGRLRMHTIGTARCADPLTPGVYAVEARDSRGRRIAARVPVIGSTPR